MRKLKTIILSLFLMTASAFMTGCNCFGGGDDNSLTIVQDTDISIECIDFKLEGETSKTPLPSTHPESGNINITCNKTDTFTIQYTLSPENVTTTTVSWEIVDIEGEDVVSLAGDEKVYSYSRKYKEQVTFKASNKGKATITFESQEP
jgi:hypothetical protein